MMYEIVPMVRKLYPIRDYFRSRMFEFPYWILFFDFRCDVPTSDEVDLFQICDLLLLHISLIIDFF